MNQQLIDKYLSDINELGFEKTLTLDSREVAKILKVQTRTIVTWAKENIGPKCKRVGKSYIYTKRDIAEFLAQN
ncbi:helix-turn-helix domain-containing protein [Arcobacter lacus]|uniref:helix-turn-helix domain-containing protein n=1 Tax=Arcobacteraceae TaxID=2808963 RepID=UPI0021BBB14B|nr:MULTISPECIES: helix-turn-helix domain-containing protein [Arcobacteraceae]MCG3715427.1 helix-turn-helix domain-containing protein [Aliarcobacter butzleri]MCT7908731.1 helix-turn-helix domain-containing protein [Arcobacter lacus]MDN5060584.1 helix-turn-helix domain-containing protein [Aliarcobacter butzleri]